MEIDHLDRLLLNLVQRDAALTSEEMAEQVPLSPSAIQRRLKRLRQQGVIVAQTAQVDPRKVGNPETYVVSLEIERERPDLLASLRAWLSAEDAVQQAFYVTGAADYLLVVTAEDTGAFDALMTRLLAQNPNVRRFSTQVVLGLVKRGLRIPVRLED